MSQVIVQDDQLAEFLLELGRVTRLALDTEADSLHAYPEKLCLIQISLPGRDALIDPLASLDLAPLWKALKPLELVLHGADYDLRLLFRGAGFVPSTVFDTMLAARFLGLRAFGLNDLAGHYLGVTLPKGAQKANWARRPLTERLLDYAQNDTRYLPPIRERLEAELSQKGCLEWHRETCARLIAECAQARVRDPDLVWRLGGSDRLTRPALAVLRSLWHWREQEALRADRPPFFILSHETLVAAAAAAVQRQPVAPLLPPHFSSRRTESFRAALDRGLAVPLESQPKHLRQVNRHFTHAQQRHFAELERRRDRQARALGLEPSFIASRALLAAVACDATGNGLMRWQRALLLD